MILIDIVIFTLLYLAVIVFDVIPLVKNNRGKNKKTLAIYLPVLLFTFVINVLYGLGVKIPNPAKPIKDIVSKIFGI